MKHDTEASTLAVSAIIIIVAHEVGQYTSGNGLLNNNTRVPNSREGKVSKSGINTIDGKKEKSIEDCLEITNVLVVEKTIYSNHLIVASFWHPR